MTLRKDCEHGRYEAHWFYLFGRRLRCPGGEFVEAAESLNLFGESELYGPKVPAKIERPRNRQAEPSMNRDGRWHSFPNVRMEQGGAPPLDWWVIADEVCVCGFRHVREGAE